MELELPGEEKKNRWDAKTEAKSGGAGSVESEKRERLSSSWVKVVLKWNVEGGGGGWCGSGWDRIFVGLKKQR